MSHRTVLALIAALIFGTCGRGIAQCPGEWEPGAGVPGVSGLVIAMLPMPDHSVIVGGQWDGAGHLNTSNICRVLPDGSVEPLGNGLRNYVSSLAMLPDGSILAGGLGYSDYSSIWRFDPSTQQWSPFGGGLYASISVVRALAVLPNGDVLAGGDFTIPGPAPINNIARYSVQQGTWLRLQAGVSSSLRLYQVQSMLVIDEDRVLVGGSLTSANNQVAGGLATLHLSTNTWSVDTPGLGNDPSYRQIRCMLAQPDGTVLIGGGFLTVNGLPIRDFARYDPNTHVWSAVGGGVYGGIVALAPLPDGSVVATGGVTVVGGVQCGALARYYPSTDSWSPIGQGIYYQNAPGIGYAVAPLGNGRILVGGAIDRTGGASAFNLIIADLTTGNTTTLFSGSDGPVRALLDLPNGDMIVGGLFSKLEGEPLSGIGIHHADGSWSPLGPGVQLAVSYGVWSLHRLPDSRILVGGLFSSAGGIDNTRNLALVDPQTGVWSSLSATPNGTVLSMLGMPDGRVIVAGSFATIGSLAAPGLAVYEPVNDAWQALIPTTGARLPQTLAWLSDGRLLVAGGDSTPAGVMGFLKAFDFTNNTWTDFHAQASSYIRSVAVLPGDDVIVAGTFSQIAGLTIPGIARYSISHNSWASLGEGLQGGGANGGVYALARRSSGDIVAAGRFVNAGTANPNLFNIASFSSFDHAWHPFGNGLTNPHSTSAPAAFTLLQRGQSDIFVGGDFHFADNNLSAFLAHWTDTCPTCHPDLNQDGNSDADDVSALLGVICGDSNPSNLDPDFNHDGNADQSDIDALITVIAGGDCP
ncbi:MAG: hypothetical protein WC718_15105 [Phycisphaerales bacterium]|jgi:hypothetical protein